MKRFILGFVMHNAHAARPFVPQRPYIVPDSPEMSHWERNNPGGWRKHSPSAAGVARPEGHLAAALGDVEVLEALAASDKRSLHAKDENGWRVS
jgi:hypothetical protein